MKSNESSIPYGKWRDESNEIGHKAEDYLENFFSNCEKQGLVMLVDQKDFGKKFEKDAVFRTDAKTDMEEGWDFGYYDSKNDKWHKIDLTIIRDSTDRTEKQRKNEEKGIKTMFARIHDLEIASKNAMRGEINKYTENVINALVDAVQS